MKSKTISAEGATPHNAWVQPLDYLSYRPRCECGWRGTIEPSVRLAEIAKERHLNAG